MDFGLVTGTQTGSLARCFNEKVYEQMHTSKVFESQLQKFVKQSTLPLHDLLDKFEDKLASTLAQPHHTDQQVEQFQQVKNDFLAKLATREDDATTQGSQDDELKNAFRRYLETKTAKGKELEKLTTSKDNTLRQSSMTAENKPPTICLFIIRSTCLPHRFYV
jgi:hypothetical protein